MNLRLPSLPRPLSALAVLSALAACGGGGPSPDPTYTVTLRYCSATSFSGCTSAPGNATDTDIDPAYRVDLEDARARVQALVTAGLVPARTRDSSGPLTCGDAPGPTIALDETVHGILILVTVRDLGSAATLASSGPCIVRTSNGLPLVAMMQLNSADIATMHANGVLSTVAFHELLHTLGFGTVWDTHHPALISGAWTTASAFVGANALQAAKTDNSAPSTWSSVPLETCGQDAPTTCYQSTQPGYNPSASICCIGTRDSHWDQATFGQETMTGWVSISAPTVRPLSATTLGSLHDLGYSIDMTKAEAFSLASPGLRALSSQPGLDLSNDVLHLTVRYADDSAAP